MTTSNNRSRRQARLGLPAGLLLVERQTMLLPGLIQSVETTRRSAVEGAVTAFHSGPPQTAYRRALSGDQTLKPPGR